MVDENKRENENQEEENWTAEEDAPIDLIRAHAGEAYQKLNELFSTVFEKTRHVYGEFDIISKQVSS